MDGATRSLLELWDTTEDVVDGLAAPDWTRPLGRTDRARACAALDTGGTDVADLVTHLTGGHPTDPDRMREELAAAHVRAGRELTHAAPRGEALAAQCLDMCLHTHDLLAALDRDLDPDEAEPAAVQACRLVVGTLPRLLACTPELRASSLRVVVRAGDGAAVIDRSFPTTGHGAAETLEADAVAMVLLLAGRRRVMELRDLVAWDGPTAERVLAAVG
ncbi:hypothetical protein [Actinomycetospora termitidis]|uniref:Mycothiol-dependent maleylpyruvate isomerase metal-binding domain-containing protein n=1 Tax=Actinomycetospora termitidis TaxID=3053470 RepID=A0ABT7M6R0_9PSEU|nr:hypothetical protein [Actinomycetospora sp. Odt1-22]MDL5155143.1 hypothetical protein [Actinomycetospora sp. Odt1-22]